MERKHEYNFYDFPLFDFYYYTQYNICRRCLGFKTSVDIIKMTNGNKR